MGLQAPRFAYRQCDVRAYEQRQLQTVPESLLMQAAAKAIAELAGKRMQALAQGSTVLVLAGPGKNGQDALLAMHWLQAHGWSCESLAGIDADSLSGLASRLPDRGLLIDGWLGLGQNRLLSDALCHAVRQINAWRAQAPDRAILSIDLPTGLHPDAGQPWPVAVEADDCLALLRPLRGLFTGQGRKHWQSLQLAALAADQEHDALDQSHRLGLSSVKAHGLINQASNFEGYRLAQRPNTAHKGQMGDVLIVGGARGMEGAVSLAVKGCLAIGVGKCFVLPLEARSSFHTWPAQVMRCSPAGFAAVLAHPQRQVIAIGCGLGAGARAIKYLRDALSSTLDLVIDADGLNLLASAPELMEQLRLSLSASSQSAASAEAIGLEHRRRVVLTPHPLEAARLLGVSRDAVENDRFAAIDALVSRSGCTVILKGAGSLVQSPLMQSLIIDCAAPALAQAGSGDFLCGMVAALLARHRGVEPQVLAAAAAWLHADGAARWSQSKRQSHALSFDALSEWISDSFAQLT